MGYFIRASPLLIHQLGHLASMWFQEEFGLQPTSARVDEGEMTVTITGTTTKTYTFDQLFNEERV